MTPEIAENLKEILDAVAAVREIDAPKVVLTVETLDARLKVVEKVISSMIEQQLAPVLEPRQIPKYTLNGNPVTVYATGTGPASTDGAELPQATFRTEATNG